MTLQDIASDIELSAFGGKPSDDLWDVNFDWICHQVNKGRAAAVGELQRTQLENIPGQFYQRLCCLEVQCETIECAGKSSGIVQRYIKLPTSLLGLGVHSVRYLGAGEDSFEELSFEIRSGGNRLNVHAYAPFVGTTVQMPYAVITESNRIDLKNMPPQFANTKYLCGELLLDLPVDSSGNYCIDKEYPMPGDLVDRVVKNVYFSINKMREKRQDQHNDSGNL